MTAGEETRLWHPFADMGSVRRDELVIERGEDVWVWDSRRSPVPRRNREPVVRERRARASRDRGRGGRADGATRGVLSVRRLRQQAGAGARRNARRSRADGRAGVPGVGRRRRDRHRRQAGPPLLVRGGRSPSGTLLISRTAGYHGTHGFGTALGGIPANRYGFGPQVETIQVPHDSLEALEAAIERAGAERVAAVFVEPVIGAGGVYPPLPGYIEGLATLCERTGVLLVVDSVICGFGRLGTWFGIERWGVEPAMIVFAKGVTSGYLPLGGVLVSERVAEPFWRAPGGPVFRHGPTYSAHATCCAAALANIALLERDGLLERGRELEEDALGCAEPLCGPSCRRRGARRRGPAGGRRPH